MIAIGMQEIQKHYGVQPILKNITTEINEGEKTAVIGSNGCGKTTLFKVISGMEQPDGGTLAIRKNARIGYLAQVAGSYPGQSVYAVLLEGVKEILQLKAQMEVLEQQMAASMAESDLEECCSRYGRIRERFEQLDGYLAEGRVDTVAAGMSIPKAQYQNAFDTLSGGEKTRVLFAAMLIAEPDILLLDEPTNHLDIAAIEWLEQYLKSYKGTVLIISHDRYFLDSAVNRIIEIEEGACQDFRGNYSYYLVEKERRLLCEFDNYLDQQKKIKQMEEAIKRLRDWGGRGDNEKFFRKAASMEKALDRMQKLDKPVLQRRKVTLSFETGGRSGKDVIICQNVDKAYGNRVIFDQADFFLRFGERIGIIGPNGSGKSTLIKLIMGVETSDSGSVQLGSNVRWGYLEQSVQMEAGKKTILEFFKEECMLDEQSARRILAKFLFYKDSVNKRVMDLSGGEKTRLRLALLMQTDINLLILDEPTNHLDIDTREVLEEALADFEGTLLFISHDRYFLNKLADGLYCLEQGRLVNYQGNYDYYREKSTQKRLAASLSAEQVPKEKKQEKHREKKAAEAAPAVDTNKLLADIEAGITALEADIALLREKMNDSANASDFNLLLQLQKDVEEKENSIAALYDRWEVLV